MLVTWTIRPFFFSGYHFYGGRYFSGLPSTYILSSASGRDPRLAHLEGAEEVLELLHIGQALEVGDGGGQLLAHLGVDDELEAGEEDAGDHDVGEGDLVADEVLLPAGEGGLDARAGALEVGDATVVAGRVERGHLQDAHDGEGHEVGDELALGEEDPLGDARLRLRVVGLAQELRRPRARQRQVLADGRRLGYAEPVGALERRHLAHRELGQELRRLVRLPHLEVLGQRDLEAVEGRDRLCLMGVMH